MCCKNKQYLDSIELLKNDAEQWELLNSKGNCVVLAGSGCGKTKTLTTKIARLLFEEVNFPRKVACLACDSQSVIEMEKRLNEISLNCNNNVFIGTIYTFLLMNIIKPYWKLAKVNLPEDIRIISGSHWENLFEDQYKKFFSDESPSKHNMDLWKVEISQYRRKNYNREDDNWLQDKKKVRFIVQFEERLRTEGMIDYDDIIVFSANIIRDNIWIHTLLKGKYPVIVIDDYQDLDEGLHHIILELCINNSIRLIAAGDPEQVSGDVSSNLLFDLTKHKNIVTIYLNTNYRCSKKIVNISKQFIGGKDIYEAFDEAEEGLIEIKDRCLGVYEQIDYVFNTCIPDIKERYKVTNKDIGVLYLNDVIGDMLAFQANSRGYKFIRFDSSAAYQKTKITEWIENCARWCSEDLASNNITLSKIIEEWSSLSIKKSKSEKLTSEKALTKFLFNNRNSNISLYSWLSSFMISVINELIIEGKHIYPDEVEAFNKLYEASKPDNALGTFTLERFTLQCTSEECLNLLNLHNVRGKYFQIAFIIGLEEKYYPKDKTSNGETDRIKRLIYSGVTRATKGAILLFSSPSEDISSKQQIRFHKKQLHKFNVKNHGLLFR